MTVKTHMWATVPSSFKYLISAQARSSGTCIIVGMHCRGGYISNYTMAALPNASHSAPQQRGRIHAGSPV